MNASVLLVEDDFETAASAELLLRDAGYQVYRASSAAEAVDAPDADVLLLDLGLPDGGGLPLISRLRDARPEARICVLSGSGAPEQRAAGLRAGADDYVQKPYLPAELRARVEALLRRGPSAAIGEIKAGPLRISRSVPCAYRDGRCIPLSPREHSLLLYLAERPGNVVGRGELLDTVWQGADVYPNTVDAHVEALRRKVDPPDAARTIRTAYGKGYYVAG